MDLIIFFNQNSGAIQAISTIALVLVTIWYVCLSRKTLLAMERAEEKRNRPRVSVFIEQTEESINFVDLVVANYGFGSARDVRFGVVEDDPSLFTKDRKLSDINIIKNGIKELPPKKEIRVPLLSLVNRVDELENSNIVLQTTYKGSVEQKQFSDEFTLDFKALTKHRIGESSNVKVAKEIESIRRILEKKK